MTNLPDERRGDVARALCASRDITDPHHEAQDVPCGPCYRIADALAPMLAGWLADVWDHGAQRGHTLYDESIWVICEGNPYRQENAE